MTSIQRLLYYMSKLKKLDSNFEIYLKQNFPEHARRILQSRVNANLIRFFYPLLSFLIPVVFFASIALLIAFMKASIISTLQNGRLSDVITNTSIQNIVTGICSAGFIFALISFMIGLMLGFSKARELLFQSEQLEASIKHIWLAEKSNKPLEANDSSIHFEPEA